MPSASRVAPSGPSLSRLSPLRKNYPKLPETQLHKHETLKHSDKFSDIIKVSCKLQHNYSLWQMIRVRRRGRLILHIEFWRRIGAQGMFFSIIEYKMWFNHYPPPMFVHNNVSALSQILLINNGFYFLKSRQRAQFNNKSRDYTLYWWMNDELY